ncbi:MULTISPECIES: hypothetical protein [Brevundimonas]|uniref:Uncharacterized protein n=1 Tax=Brevundimonas vancanneytii TaxID=1325724 RepID=A0A4P1K0R1_9CAUL|nr:MULTISPECIES: hypothetical protein [Brevundimonas]VTO13987.1 Uncharacterised protein [Brevundimonas vancanneytii]
MPYEHKTEYHLIPPGSHSAEDWFDDRDEAIAAAVTNGEGWKVERVISYLDDKTMIWPHDEDA